MTRSLGDPGDLHVKMSVLATAVALTIVVGLTDGNTAQLPRWKFTDEGKEVFFFFPLPNHFKHLTTFSPTEAAKPDVHEDA